MSRLRDLVRDHWSALAGSVPSAAGRFAVTETAVRTPFGAVCAALDGDGRRHLLVPLAPTQTFDPDTRSSGVHLLPRELGVPKPQRYADLVLNDARLVDVFTSLCADVIGAVAKAPDDAVKVTREVLAAWRELLDAARVRLGPGGAVGLFGELVVLERLLDHDRGAVGVWTGPFGTAHDFHRLDASIEVKSTASPDGMSFRVHGLDQLDPGPGRLWLAWMRLERHPAVGRTIPELVDKVLGRTDDARRLSEALLRVGLDDTARAELQAMRFNVVEEAWIEVTPSFPRLVASHLVGGHPPPGVADVHYTVDLTSAAFAVCEPETVVNTLLGV